MLKQPCVVLASVVLSLSVVGGTAHAELAAPDPVRSTPTFRVRELGAYIELATSLQTADRTNTCKSLTVLRVSIRPLLTYSHKRAQEGRYGASVVRVRLAAKLAAAGLDELRLTCAGGEDTWIPNSVGPKILSDAALVFRSIDADAHLWVK